MPANHNESVAEESSQTGRPWVVGGLIGLLLVMHAGAGFDCSRRMSVTHDEYWHLPVGLLNLTTGQFGFDTLNPPLVREWAALPLLFTSARPGPADRALDAVGHGDAFLSANRDRYEHWLAMGRRMIVVLSVMTGVGLALWAKRWFGNAAAVLTVLLWTTCPNVIAHASLVTTDLAAALFYVWTLFLLDRYARHPGWGRAAGLGICLGLAQLAKYTSILLYPLCAVLWFVHRAGNPHVDRRKILTLAGQWVMSVFLSLLVLNAGYLFRGSGMPLGRYQFGSDALRAMSERLQPLHGWPVPLPRDYLVGVDRQRRIMESRHPVYLDGEWSTHGFGRYYLMALWYKLPHAAQLLVLLCGLFLIRPARQPRFGRKQLALLLPAAALLAVASGSGMQLGIRYVLPVLPLLFLFAGQTARWLEWPRYRIRTLCVVLLGCGLFWSLRYHPHHLAYFNESAGGPLGGRAHLLDSNLDWGQDLGRLDEFISAHPEQEWGLAYFGAFPPAALGIDYQIPSDVPQPGWYAVSVNFVQGRPHTVRDRRNEFRPVNINEFGYFRLFAPQARIGYSIDVFHLTDADVARWRTWSRRTPP